MKREILNDTNKRSRKLPKPEKKSIADITYGMLAAKSCLLTVAVSYLQDVKKAAPSESSIHIDDSDVVKPDGYKFEALGVVRDGSVSTCTKNVYSKGYHVTEACILTTNNHLVGVFSRIHSSEEKDYKLTNTITFDTSHQGVALFQKATFSIDRGYDDNKMFLNLVA